MENELTVRVDRPAIPAMSWNKDEVERNIDEMLAAYKGRVYTPESIKSAKEDRAKVNGLDKQLGAAATAAKKLYMKPLEDFQQSIKEMQGKCKEISGAIDAQVKTVEAAEKEEKASTLRLIYRDNIGELEALIPFERLLDNRWLNKTFAISEAKKTLCQSIENIRSDLDFIRENCGEDVEPCTTEYLRNLSVNEAVREHTRREKSRAAQRDAEAAREAAERARMSAPVIVSPDRRRTRDAGASRRSNTSCRIHHAGWPVGCRGDADDGCRAAQRTGPQEVLFLGRVQPGRHQMVPSSCQGTWVRFRQHQIIFNTLGGNKNGFHFTRWRCCAEYYYHSSEPLLRCSGQAERSNAAGRRI